MATHINILPGTLYPQPGATIQVDKEGKWTATEVYLCHRLSAVALMPRPGTAHPEISFIEVATASINYGEGDVAEITCQYAGAEDKDPEDEKKNAVYSMGLSVGEENILLCYRYKDLVTSELEALKGLMAGKDKDDQTVTLRSKVTSTRGLEALAKIDRGQTSYYCPKITWRESWVRNRPVEAAELNKIGKIDTPLGPAPTLAGTRNWLRNGCTQEQDGKAFKLELEWLASNEEGWDPNIYA
jgi:hypothetical protein